MTERHTGINRGTGETRSQVPIGTVICVRLRKGSSLQGTQTPRLSRLPDRGVGRVEGGVWSLRKKRGHEIVYVCR